MKKHDVTSVCNALVDILVEAKDEDLQKFEMSKGIMHLVDSERQGTVLDHFDGHDQHIELGGSAMNAIRTLAAVGKKTVFAGMVSDDEFGERIKHRMQELGIVARLGVSHERTGSCVVLVTPDGERTMNTHLGASRLYTEAQIPHDEIADSKVLHFCGYQWDTDGQKRAIKEAVKTARKSETMVSFDVADPFVVERNREDFLELINEGADVVFANKEEAKLLYESTPEEAAAKIAATGAVAVVKLGGDGALVRKGDTVHRVDAVKTKVVDTTAAGDMFAAGFLNGLTSGKPLDTCGYMAAYVASDVISRLGAHVSDEALAKLKTL